MSYRAEPKGSMKAYLQQRSAEDAVAERAKITSQHLKAHEFIRDYRARGRKSAFNWSPTITVTKTKETTSEEIHHQEAAKVSVAQGVGDAPGAEGAIPADRGIDEAAADASQSRFAIAGHTDFGDGDTPF